MRYYHFNKSTADRCLHLIYRRIKSEEVVVRLSKSLGPHYSGEVQHHDEDTVITLHPDKDVIPSFIHEYLHILHPDARERKIVQMEKELMSLWGNRQLENLLCRLTLLVRNRPVTRDKSDGVDRRVVIIIKRRTVIHG